MNEESGMTTMHSDDDYLLQFDGGSRGNPGESGAGAVIFRNGKVIAQTHQYLGPNKTNNQAEYRGLIIGLQLAKELGINQHLTIRGDSKLVISQVAGKWKINNENLKELCQMAITLLRNLEITYKLEHVCREGNKIADSLANKAIDMKDEETTIFHFFPLIREEMRNR